MQPVTDLQFFQFAQIVIKLGQCAFFVLAHLDAAITVKADADRQFKDVAFEDHKTAGINRGSIIVFIDQRFEILERPIALRPG